MSPLKMPLISRIVVVLQMLCLLVHSQDIGYTQMLQNAQKTVLHAHKLSKSSGDLNRKNDYTEKAIEKAKNILSSKSITDLRENANKTISPRCLNQTILFIENLVNMKPWALSMFDSMGKLPSDIMGGNIQWLGSYDECLNITAQVHVDIFNNQSNQEKIHGRYCRVGLPIVNMSGAQNPMMAAGFTPGSLIVGLCVPDSCDHEDVLGMIKADLNFIPIPDLPKATQVVCQYEDLDYDSGAVVAIVILSFIGVMLLLGTVYDVIFIQYQSEPVLHSFPPEPNGDAVGSNTEDDGGVNDIQYKIPNEHSPLLSSKKSMESNSQPGLCGKVLLAFSVYTNASKILSTKQSVGSLKAVNGIRVFSMTWVLLGHTYVFGLSTTENIMPFFMGQLQNWTFQAIVNASVSVDSFFVLSGLLLSYLILKEMKKNGGKISWPMFYFHRFWRLTPCYMLILMTYTTLFTYWDDGPMWPQQGLDKTFCQETWWTNLLYINNFVKTEKMCIGWSWYLSNDMQFYVVSPLMFVPLYFSGIIGGIVCLVFLLATFITSGVISSYYGMPAALIGGGGRDTGFVHFFDYYYIKPYCRIGPYVIGIITGYILYKTECKVRMSKMLNLLGWAIATACALAVLYGLFEVEKGHPISVDLAAFYNAVNRTVWAMSLCWVVFSCATGYGGFVNTILSWNAWIPIGRLTYCGYLLHPIVMYVYYFQRQRLYYLSTMELVYTYFGHLVTTYAVSFMVSLAFEAPWMGLEKVIFKRDRRS